MPLRIRVPALGGTDNRQPIYIGPSARAVRYLGTQTDAQLYIGNPAKKLFP